MKITIRSKLILAISLMMVVLFSLVAILFINEKKVEIADDIYVNSLAFSKLTSSTVVDIYDLYLAQSGFVYFNREMQNIFEQNDDVTAIQVVSFAGELLYDSREDVDKKFDGGSRPIEDIILMSQIKSENIAIRTLSNGVDARTLYLAEGEACAFDISLCTSEEILRGQVKYVDENEREIAPLGPGVLIDYIVVPASEKYSIVYYLDYQNLRDRVALMKRRIIYLAVFGVMMGMLLSFFMSKEVTRPVAQLVKGVDKIAKGDFKVRVNIKTHDELSFLGKSFNKMAGDLEESMEAKLYKERVTRELELATEIQERLIPKTIPSISGIEIDAGLIPAEEIGGDMYDFLPFSKDRLFIYLGDVTGHGVPAGIISSIASALFYGFAGHEDLKRIMIDVNRVLTARTMTTMFMTLCLISWNGETKELKYVSGGHEQLVHYKAREGKAVLTPSGGVALGMLPDVTSHLKVENVDFESGDFIVVYSDGIPEAWRSQKEQYGMQRLINIVQANGKLQSATKMKNAILTDLNNYVSGYKQMDDITLVVIRRV